MKKRMSLISMLLIGTLMTAALTGCGKDASETNNRESINQVSLLQGLTFGDYNGKCMVYQNISGILADCYFTCQYCTDIITSVKRMR